MSEQVVVRDSKQDMDLLFRQFPHLRRQYARQMKSGAFGPAPFNTDDRLPFEPETEPDTYLTPAGKSSYRGSKALIDEGTPADVVRREYYTHIELMEGKPRIFHPEVLNKVDKSKINFDAGPISGVPPKQDDFFTSTEEGKQMIRLYGKSLKNSETPRTIDRNNYRISAYGYQPIPPSNYHEDTSSPPPSPPMYNSGRYDEMPRRDPSILEPLAKPWEPSSDDIVKVLGWNEGNMKLLTKVSKRIGRCSEILTKINSVNQEVDVDELMSALQTMDNEAFRKVFADIFQNQLKKYMDLSAEIQSYLNGTAVIEEPSTNEDYNTESSVSEGTVSIISANDTISSSQDAPDNSVQPSQSESSGQSSTNSNETPGEII